MTTAIAPTRTLNPWLVREDKALLDAVTGRGARVDIFALARTLDRSAISVLRRLRTTERSATMTQALERGGMWLDLSEGLDQEAEFWGLALSGVPLSLAWRWCVDDSEQGVGAAAARPTAEAIEAAMTTADLRPAMSLVRDARLWFEDEGQIESLRFLMAQPFAAVVKAVRGVVAHFDAPTPKLVAQGIFGVFSGLADAAVFDGVRLVFGKKKASRGKGSKSKSAGAMAGKTSTKRAYKRKSSRTKKATSLSGAWWAKYKKTGSKSEVKRGSASSGRKHSVPQADDEQHLIVDGPRIIEYI